MNFWEKIGDIINLTRKHGYVYYAMVRTERTTYSRADVDYKLKVLAYGIGTELSEKEYYKAVETFKRNDNETLTWHHIFSFTPFTVIVEYYGYHGEETVNKLEQITCKEIGFDGLMDIILQLHKDGAK